MRFKTHLVLVLSALLTACSDGTSTKQVAATDELPLNLLIVKEGFTLDKSTVEKVSMSKAEDAEHYNIHIILTENASKALDSITMRSLEDVLLPVYGDTIISKGSTIQGPLGRDFIMTGYDKATAEKIVAGVKKLQG